MFLLKKSGYQKDLDKNELIFTILDMSILDKKFSLSSFVKFVALLTVADCIGMYVLNQKSISALKENVIIYKRYANNDKQAALDRNYIQYFLLTNDWENLLDVNIKRLTTANMHYGRINSRIQEILKSKNQELGAANFEYDSFKREQPKLNATDTDQLQKELDLLGRLIAYTESYLKESEKGHAISVATLDSRRKLYLLKSQMLERSTFASKATMLNKPVEQFNFSTLALWVSGLK
ncbi:MAG: hypothetical protein MJ218_01800 [Opitutales bacterium]|nr:hypothetical protein [Opitutales bacterium]